MNVLIIGGTGFIGYHIVSQLISDGHGVGVIALPPIPEGIRFPDGVSVFLADMKSLSDRELIDIMIGYDSFVFAAGADDRSVPARPSYPYFFDSNVNPVIRLTRLAVKAGLKAGLVMGSYYTHFNRIWPELQMAERHPYIRSRVEQQRLGFDAAGEKFRLMFLELPFIFGSMPGRKPLWTPLIGYINSGWPVYCPKGGTSAVSVRTVAAAAVGALENGQARGCYPIGEENLSWNELFSRLAGERKKNLRLHRLPVGLLKLALSTVWLVHRMKGKEGGLDFRRLSSILLSETFLDSRAIQAELDYSPAGLEEAFKKTLRL